MASRILNRVQVAECTIEETFKKFLRVVQSTNGISKVDRRAALELFTDCINGYGHQSLSKRDDIAFDCYYSLSGSLHKEFCQFFGPDKIIENVREFVGDFLIRKVMMSGRQKAVVAFAVAELCQWLVAQGIVSAEDARDAIAMALRAAKAIPLAEDANRLLYQQTKTCPEFGASVQEFLDFGSTNISCLETNAVWLRSADGKEIGPVSLPQEITRLLQPGWTINCALLKSGGNWHISEVGNVYPNWA